MWIIVEANNQGEALTSDAADFEWPQHDASGFCPQEMHYSETD